MKYILVDEVKGDMFTEEFETKETAIEAGEREFSHFSEYDKRQREAFYVLESVNPDEDAADHFDGNFVKEWI